jgi:hypothetical protein
MPDAHRPIILDTVIKEEPSEKHMEGLKKTIGNIPKGWEHKW